MSDRIDHAAEAVGLLALAVAAQHQGDPILADAIYAAGQALHADACTEGDPHDCCDCGDWDREAEIAVRAALPFIAAARDDVPRLLAGVRRLQAADERVRALHRPVDIEPSDTICGECSYGLRNGRYLPPVVEYPCPTIAALDGGE